MSYGVFSRGGDKRRVGWRIGDGVVDLSEAGLGEVFRAPSLNPFMEQGPAAWSQTLAKIQNLPQPEVAPLAEVELHLPFEVGDYVDFYSSIEHATTMGRMFRPQGEPLLPNWRWLPVGYHGRGGTIVPSGTPIVRPSGQVKAPDAEEPTYGPSRRLDIELELGFVVGVGSELGQPVPTESFRDHVFGVVLVNDWSARDIQAWEYQPLGPFLGKSFATTISAWVTPLELLDPHRVAQPEQSPEPLPYLRVQGEQNFDLALEVGLNGEIVSRANARDLYWSGPQQLAHLTVNGASVRSGDLFATGTISGAEHGSEGSFIELWRGERFLEDGDEVVLRGRAGDVELGEVRGRIEPAASTA